MAEIVYIPIQLLAELLAVLEALVAEAVIQATTLVELQDSLEEQGMIGTELQQELTEQKAAQQAVEAERQQYQTLFNLAPDGPHGKARPGDWDSECAARAWLRDALGEAQALPQRVYDGEGAVGPGIHHAPLGGGRPHRLGSTFVQDTAGEVAPTLGGLGLRSAAALGEQADLRARFVRMPHALAPLKRRDEGASSPFWPGCPPRHGRQEKGVPACRASQPCPSRSLGFGREVSLALRILPTHARRTMRASWLQWTCCCQRRVGGCDRLSSAAHYYVEAVEQTMLFLAILSGRT